jgi:hypothetical protein
VLGDDGRQELQLWQHEGDQSLVERQIVHARGPARTVTRALLEREKKTYEKNVE